MKKMLYLPVLLVGLILIAGCSEDLQNPSNNLVDKRYLQDPKFCIKDPDCISYTNCNNPNEPRNIFFDNSLTPNYNPDLKCNSTYFAYAGNETKCNNNICEYKRCYPLFEVKHGIELTASEVYSEKCTEKTNKEVCESVDIYNAEKGNFGNSDGIMDCEWK